MKVELTYSGENFDLAGDFLRGCIEVLLFTDPLEIQERNFTFQHKLKTDSGVEQEVKIVLTPEELAALPQKKEKWLNLSLFKYQDILLDEEL